MLGRGSNTAVSHKLFFLKGMFHEPHQKHCSLFHTDRNKIYTLDIPFCDLVPAPHKAFLISELPMQTFNRVGRWKPWMRRMAETQNSLHATSIPARGSSSPNPCPRPTHKSSLFSQHSRAPTLPMSHSKVSPNQCC